MATSTQAQAQGSTRLPQSTLGCFDRNDHERLIQFHGQKDDVASARYLEKVITEGDCTWLLAGTEIFVEELGSIEGFSCVRPRGEIECLYVIHLALIQPE